MRLSIAASTRGLFGAITGERETRRACCSPRGHGDLVMSEFGQTEFGAKNEDRTPPRTHRTRGTYAHFSRVVLT